MSNDKNELDALKDKIQTLEDKKYKEEKTLEHTFRMVELEFEQRSQQVIALSQDRSKFLRIALIVWGAPLLIGASLIGNGLNLNLTNLDSPLIILLVICFHVCAIINWVFLVANISNSNSARLAVSGINYLRNLYFKFLIDFNFLELNDELAKIVSIDKEGQPVFHLVNSKSTKYSHVSFGVVNCIYSLIGLLFSLKFNIWGIVVSGLVFVGIILIHKFAIFNLRDFKGINE